MVAGGVTVAPGSMVVTSPQQQLCVRCGCVLVATKPGSSGMHGVRTALGSRMLSTLQCLWLWYLKHRYMQSIYRPGVWCTGTCRVTTESGSDVWRDLGAEIQIQIQRVCIMYKAVRTGSSDPRAAQPQLFLREVRQHFLPQGSPAAVAVGYLSGKSYWCPLQNRLLTYALTDTMGFSSVKAARSPRLLCGLLRSSASKASRVPHRTGHWGPRWHPPSGCC